MPDKFIRKLGKLVSTDRIVEMDRSPVTDDSLRGFVVQANARFVLLNVIDDSFFLNGFAIFPTDTIGRFRVMEEERAAMIRYVLSQRYPEGYPERPLFDTGELQDFSFLERIHDGYPIITVSREEIDDTVCAIGRVERIKRKSFRLQTMDVDARWDNVEKFRYRDVTRIDFGGNYEEALWMYATHREAEASAPETQE